MYLLKRKSWALLLAVAAAVFLATPAATQSVQAQEPRPPHDLAISFRHGLTGTEGGEWIFILTNQGGRHAHSGEVQVSFTPYLGGTVSAVVARGPFDMGIDPKFGRFDPATGIWHFRNLAPGQATELKLYADLSGNPVGVPGGSLVIGRAEIVSSWPREESMFLYNNATREAWKNFRGGPQAAEGNARLEMGVGDRSPEVNDTVDFTVRFQNHSPGFGSLYTNFDMYGVLVKVSPSQGLDLVSAAAPSRTYDHGTPDPEDDTHISSSFDLSTGIWNLGSVPESRFGLQIDMPVTVRYTGAAPLEEACLTAELVNVVPPERTYDPVFQRDNVVSVCLGDDDPTVLIREGEFPLFTFYPCVGETAYPCNDQDTLELVALINRADMSKFDIGIDRSDIYVSDRWHTVLQPESMVLQVEDT